MKAIIVLGFNLVMINLFSAQAYGQDYDLTCAFGPGITVTMKPVTTPTHIGVQLLAFGFTPASKPATQGVDPGTCAWSDRAFRQGEPSVLALVTNDTSLTFYVNNNGTTSVAPSTQSWVGNIGRAGYKKIFKVHSGTVPEMSYQVLVAEP